jgi:hypothetical protein
MTNVAAEINGNVPTDNVALLEKDEPEKTSEAFGPATKGAETSVEEEAPTTGDTDGDWLTEPSTPVEEIEGLQLDSVPECDPAAKVKPVAETAVEPQPEMEIGTPKQAEASKDVDVMGSAEVVEEQGAKTEDETSMEKSGLVEDTVEPRDFEKPTQPQPEVEIGTFEQAKASDPVETIHGQRIEVEDTISTEEAGLNHQSVEQDVLEPTQNLSPHPEVEIVIPEPVEISVEVMGSDIIHEQETKAEDNISTDISGGADSGLEMHLSQPESDMANGNSEKTDGSSEITSPPEAAVQSEGEKISIEIDNKAETVVSVEIMDSPKASPKQKIKSEDVLSTEKLDLADQGIELQNVAKSQMDSRGLDGVQTPRASPIPSDGSNESHASAITPTPISSR